ncbi:hypothetical protein C8J57DRAFT_1413184 [Mycena rebaudengoi]|nr:hypothetical protein C8J57DRAFT_1413184 [Mycena rebaudengoi]
MIIPDEDDDEYALKRAGSLRLPEAVAGRSSQVSLPSYEISQLQAQRSSSTLASFRKSARFTPRFWKITFIVLATYVFLTIVIGVPVVVIRTRNSQPPPPTPTNVFLLDNDRASPLMNGVLVSDDIKRCDDWDDVTDDSLPGFSASLSRTLSPTGLFSVRSNATDEITPTAAGNLTVDINPDASVTKAIFYVALTASSIRVREQAHICFASSGDDRGISVYIPSVLAPGDNMTFDIRLLFPQDSHGLYPNPDLITYLPMFQQSFGNLSPRIQFTNVNIAGAGVEIVCDSLQAHKMSVTSSCGPISGSFNVTESLLLDNVGGSISTNITLTNDPTTRMPTYLSLSTGNSDINANISMVAPALNSLRPMFNAQVKTFNGSLALNVAHKSATPPSALDLLVETNQARSNVVLDGKFSGVFDLRTKLASAKLRHPDPAHMTDPTGARRRWQVISDANSTSATRGWLGWGARPKFWDPAEDARVRVTSALGPILVQLVP